MSRIKFIYCSWSYEPKMRLLQLDVSLLRQLKMRLHPPRCSQMRLHLSHHLLHPQNAPHHQTPGDKQIEIQKANNTDSMAK